MFGGRDSRPGAGLRLGLCLLMVAACADEDPTTGAERLLTRCLETSPATPKSFVLGGTWSTECGDGTCEETLRIESVCVSYQRIDGDGELVQLNHGILSAAGVSAGKAEAAALVDVDLRADIDRCGGEACDEGIIVLQRSGEGSVHSYAGRPEGALEGALDHLEAIRDALGACQRTALVDIDGGCER